jgi:DNA-binding GntR family transcriptional regulator
VQLNQPRTIKELVTRSSLIIGIFGSTGIASCQDDDHSKIIEAFETSDQELAAELMKIHLNHIQTDVNLDTKPGSPIDLKTLFVKTDN